MVEVILSSINYRRNIAQFAANMTTLTHQNTLKTTESIPQPVYQQENLDHNKHPEVR